MGNVAEALHHMEKCLPSLFVECAAALENTLSQFFHLQIHLPVYVLSVLDTFYSILRN